MARIKKSKVVNGFSYHFSDDKLIGIVNNGDSAYPSVLDPSSNLFSDLANADEALQQFNIAKYGGNIDSFADSITQSSKEEQNRFYDAKKSQENINKDLNQTPYPNVQDGISSPNLAFAQYKNTNQAMTDTYTDADDKIKTTELLTYPLDIDPKQDHMKITKYEYRRNSEQASAGLVNASQPVRSEPEYESFTPGEQANRLVNFLSFGKIGDTVERRIEGYRDVAGGTMLGNRLMGSVLLPMPKVVDTNGAEWGESELNIFGLQAVGLSAALGVGKKDMAAQAERLGISVEELKQAADISDAAKGGDESLAKKLKGMGGAIGAATASELTARATGQTVTQDQILARTGGQVLNPNAELLFAGPVLRDFNFDFLMIARSRKEGEEIRKIIRWFKSGMAPKYQSSTFLKTPDVFTLEYKNGPGGNDVLKTVNRFSPGGLALRTIAVDYATNGYWSAYQDSQPVAVKMSMNFAELRPIYAQDQNDPQMQGSVGY